jgi:hypothetical protein
MNHRFRVLGVVVAIIAALLIVIGLLQRAKESGLPSETSGKPYRLPAELSLNAHAQRESAGGIYIVGATNFPDGMKLWVQVESGRLPLGAPRVVASDDEVMVIKGTFRSRALWEEIRNPYFFPEMLKWRPDGAGLKFVKRPFRAGSYRVHFEAYFNNTWQSETVLSALGGSDGKRLHGRLLKRTDPDVVDSPTILDGRITMPFPPLSNDAKAISLVKAAVLSVPGKGRSAMDVEMDIKGLMQFGYFHMDGSLPSMRPAKGWSAKASGADVYEVAYDFIDGDSGEVQAVWSADLKTGRVRYVNERAKIFSWTPNY